MKIVFIERDGIIIRKSPDEYVDSLEKLELIPGVINGLRRLIYKEFHLVMISNQENLGTTEYPREKFDVVQNKVIDILKGEGITFTGIFTCPHAANHKCDCRKPNVTMLKDLFERHDIDLVKSFVIGNETADIELADNIGCNAILINPDEAGLDPDRMASKHQTVSDISEACDYIVKRIRSATVNRKTTETNISVTVFINGNGSHSIQTGIGFFDHMLSQIAKHSLIDMNIAVDGDLHVDEHHTIEDTGLALGSCIRKALGDKKGIERYGFVLPMDESQATVALDLGGRPFFKFEGSFVRERVGELPTELVEDFFRAFADGLRANLHISFDGRNDHHKIEAIFKAVARTLRDAVRIDPRAEEVIPSTKGIV